MKFLKKLFSGKTPEEHERRGDMMTGEKSFGQAKLSYEKALQKLEKVPDPEDSRNIALKERLTKKHADVIEMLAGEHNREAGDLMESGCLEEALELVVLAMELTRDPKLRDELQDKQRRIEESQERELEMHYRELDYETEDDETSPPPAREEPADAFSEETFHALCAGLPDDVQKEYLSYGDNFVTGYLALNEEDFENAADYLSRAMAENPSPKSFIPLELATAFFNLERLSEARDLLETFIGHRPDVLPAYQLLCEILWEQNDFEAARALLDTIPEDKTETVPVFILKGETLFQEGKLREAKAFFLDILNTRGWNESIAQALAKCHVTLDEPAEARNLYGEMMSRCTGCGSKVDSYIKKRFADLSFQTGDMSTSILEIYLSIAREFPALMPECYDKVSRIYAARGDEIQARRFKAFSDLARRQ